jgi:hypothetical protein
LLSNSANSPGTTARKWIVHFNKWQQRGKSHLDSEGMDRPHSQRRRMPACRRKKSWVVESDCMYLKQCCAWKIIFGASGGSTCLQYGRSHYLRWDLMVLGASAPPRRAPTRDRHPPLLAAASGYLPYTSNQCPSQDAISTSCFCSIMNDDHANVSPPKL